MTIELSAMYANGYAVQKVRPVEGTDEPDFGPQISRHCSQGEMANDVTSDNPDVHRIDQPDSIACTQSMGGYLASHFQGTGEPLGHGNGKSTTRTGQVTLQGNFSQNTAKKYQAFVYHSSKGHSKGNSKDPSKGFGEARRPDAGRAAGKCEFVQVTGAQLRRLQDKLG